MYTKVKKLLLESKKSKNVSIRKATNGGFIVNISWDSGNGKFPKYITKDYICEDKESLWELLSKQL